jgi:hypothetical protein
MRLKNNEEALVERILRSVAKELRQLRRRARASGNGQTPTVTPVGQPKSAAANAHVRMNGNDIVQGRRDRHEPPLVTGSPTAFRAGERPWSAR